MAELFRRTYIRIDAMPDFELKSWVELCPIGYSVKDSIVPIRTESAYLNQKQSAAHCGVSYSTFRRWRALEEFPSPIRVGGILRWRIVDLDCFMASNQRQAVAV